jgi:hypothetical protein
LGRLGGEAPRQLLDEAVAAPRAHEQRIQLEPQVAVVTRLGAEMAHMGGQQAEQLFLHRRDALSRARS